jgi:hypothetical protein
MAHRDRYGERPKVYLVCDELARILEARRRGGSSCHLALLIKIFLPTSILAILHNVNIVAIEQNKGAQRLSRAFPVHTEWPLSKREYDRRHLDMRWPSGTEATIELSRYSPEINDETIVPTLHPPLEGPGDDQKTLERLREIKRRLDME